MPKIDIKNHEISYSFNGVSKGIDGFTIVLIHGAGGQEIDWPKAWRNTNVQPGYFDERSAFRGPFRWIHSNCTRSMMARVPALNVVVVMSAAAAAKPALTRTSKLVLAVPRDVRGSPRVEWDAAYRH